MLYHEGAVVGWEPCVHLTGSGQGKNSKRPELVSYFASPWAHCDIFLLVPVR